VWRVGVLLWNRSKIRAQWLTSLAGVLAGAIALATACHWIALRFFGLLLPLNRTALFYVPLGMLCVGALAAIPIDSRMGRASYHACVAVLSLFALHFALSLRLTYFGEWRYGADIKSVYAALADYNREYCVEQVGSNWLYSSSLNFYRRLSGRESFPEFQPGLPLPGDAAVYVLNGNFDRGFIQAQKLSIVYRSESTDAVIAIRPESLVRRQNNGYCP
jgi:hypothetical protein